MQNKVSIIMLSYNPDDSLYESIKSVFNQDYPNLELVIADDCSINFEVVKIRDFLLKNNKSDIDTIIIRNDVNIGTVKNINNAIKHSNGDYIIYLSAGDIFFNNNVVSKIINEFDIQKCDSLVTRRLMYDGDISNVIGYIPSDYDIKKIKAIKSPKESFVSLFTGNFHNMASGSVFACKRELLVKNDYYDEKYRLWEDGPFFAKLYRNGNVINYNYDIVSIYYRQGGVSTGKVSDALRNDIRIFFEYGLSERKMIKGFNRRILKYRYIRKFVAVDNKLILNLYRCCYADVMIYRCAQNIAKKAYNISHLRLNRFSGNTLQL